MFLLGYNNFDRFDKYSLNKEEKDNRAVVLNPEVNTCKPNHTFTGMKVSSMRVRVH